MYKPSANSGIYGSFCYYPTAEKALEIPIIMNNMTNYNIIPIQTEKYYQVPLIMNNIGNYPIIPIDADPTPMININKISKIISTYSTVSSAVNQLSKKLPFSRVINYIIAKNMITDLFKNGSINLINDMDKNEYNTPIGGIDDIIASFSSHTLQKLQSISDKSDTGDTSDIKEDEPKVDVIYHATWFCPYSQRVRSVLEIKGIKYKFMESQWTYDHSSGKRVAKKPKTFTQVYRKAIGNNPTSDGQAPIIKIVKTKQYYTESQPCCRVLDNIFKNVGPSVMGYDDSDILFKNDLLNEYITGKFGKVTTPKDKDGIVALKKELKILNDKIIKDGAVKGEGYIFGDNGTLSDTNLLPYICRISSKLKYFKLEKKFNFHKYLRNHCPRLHKWYAFVMQQKWAQNVTYSDEDYIQHYKEFYGK